MASIRSRRKKLTTLLTDVNSRLKSVELRSVGQIAAAAAATESDEVLVTPGSYIDSIAPSTWKKVIGGWYYPAKLTGTKDRVELFLSTDSGLTTGEAVEVSGIHSPIEVSKTKNVLGVGAPVGTYRTNKAWYKPITTGATHAILYSIGATSTSSTAKALVTKHAIASFSATTTEATIVFSAAHTFREGDVVNVSDLGGSMAGIDGLFKVTAVPSTTSIKYEFSPAIGAAIPSTPATANKFVYATLHEFVKVGDSWINTQTTPDTLYIWNGVRWVTASDPNAVVNDKKNPGAPTGLAVTTTTYPKEEGNQKATGVFSWTAPTVNADGTELTDLGGFSVRWKGTKSTGGKWVTAGGYALLLENEVDVAELTPGETVTFQVRAIDTGGNLSTWASIDKLIGLSSQTLFAPSPPSLTTRLGTVTVRWNGLQSDGSVPPNYLSYVEVHMSTSSGFTPSTSTLLGKIDRTGNDFFVITNLAYNETNYVRLVFVDKDGKKSIPSSQVMVTVKPLVDTDIIGKILSGANIVPGSITASESIIGNTITGNLIQALTIEAGSIKGNTITADKLEVGTINATYIAANAITASKISADAVTADKIKANSITATNGKIQSLDAGIITAGTLVGRNVIAGTTSGKRITLNSAYGRIYIYDTNNANQGYIEGQSGSGGGLVLVPNGGVGTLVLGGSYWSIGGSGNESIFGNSLGTMFLKGRLTLSSYDAPLILTNRYLIANTANQVLAQTTLNSDYRLKTETVDASDVGLDFINQLRPVRFKWKGPNGTTAPRTTYGLIAQEVKAVLASNNIADTYLVDAVDKDSYPGIDLGSADDSEVLGIDYFQLIPALIQSSQELSQKVDRLEAEIQRLKEGTI